MDNHQINRKPRYMDIVGGKRPVSRPVAASHPVSPAPRPAQPIRELPGQPRRSIGGFAAPKRPASRPHDPQAFTDPIAARPVSRPAAPSPAPRPIVTAPRPVQAPGAALPRPAAPKVVQTTTVKTVAATEDRVESFEFGIIEDLSPVVKPEPPMVPGTRPSILEKPDHSSSEYLRVTPEPEPEPEKKESPLHFPRRERKAAAGAPKSPFLTSVSVPKRPLSASAPTGIHTPAPVIPKPPKPEKPAKKKRKNAPFIVIVILSVLLGVSLGALVYFVLPH